MKQTLQILSIFKKYTANRAVFIAIISILITAGSVAAYKVGRGTDLDTIKVERGELKEIVSVTGRVKSADGVNLSFESGGRISWIIGEEGSDVRSGQALAYVSSSDTQADLAQAEAILKSEEAKLENLKNGAKDEEIFLQEVLVNESRKNLNNIIREAFNKSDNAIRAEAFKAFDDLRSNNSFPLQSYNSSLARDIEDLRVKSDRILSEWQDLLYVDANNLYLKSENVKDYIYTLSLFVDKLNQAVNEAENRGGASQDSILAYRSLIYSARTSLNASLTAVLAAEEELDVAIKTLALKKSSASPLEIKVQEALVDKARANVLRFQSEVSKKAIISPIDGIITKMNLRVGETVISGTPVVSVIGETEYEIESFIPEADIEKVSVGDKASVTLDAYGSAVLFEAVVSEIDPAETLLEGVPTYKTTFSFIGEDERIKSGMTANIDIVTEEKTDTLFVPMRAVNYKSDGDYLTLLADDGSVKEIKVILGIRDEAGLVEVRGVSEGDIIVIPE